MISYSGTGPLIRKGWVVERGSNQLQLITGIYSTTPGYEKQNQPRFDLKM